MITLDVKPFEQTKGLCGPASLKMVLEYFGIDKTEKELAKISGANSSRGSSAKGLIRAAKKSGLKGFVKDFCELKDIEKYVLIKKIPVIVDWFSVDDGHYSVVVGIDKENIYLQDPEWGEMRAMDLETFKRVWFDFPGDFITSKKELNVRRIIVIEK